MNNRRIALGLGTGAGALLGAALLSGLTSPIAAADTYAVDPVTGTTVSDTLPAFGGLGTDVVSSQEYANYDIPTTGTPSIADVSGALTAATGAPGYEEVLTNTYSNPFFTDTSTDVTAAFASLKDLTDAGSLAGNVGTTTDTIYFDPSLLGNDFGIFYESVPGATSTVAPTVTEDLITPFGSFPLGNDLSLLGGSGGLGDFTSLLGGSDLTSLLGGSGGLGDLTSLLGGGDGLGSLMTGGDLLTGLDPFLQVLTAF